MHYVEIGPEDHDKAKELAKEIITFCNQKGVEPHHLLMASQLLILSNLIATKERMGRG